MKFISSVNQKKKEDIQFITQTKKNTKKHAKKLLKKCTLYLMFSLAQSRRKHHGKFQKLAAFVLRLWISFFDHCHMHL